jgi:hypothetical protein
MKTLILILAVMFAIANAERDTIVIENQHSGVQIPQFQTPNNTEAYKAVGESFSKGFHDVGRALDQQAAQYNDYARENMTKEQYAKYMEEQNNTAAIVLTVTGVVMVGVIVWLIVLISNSSE